MKINVIGWYDQINLGETAFKQVISKTFEGHELAFSNQYVPGSDRVIVGAGGVFTPNYFESIPRDVPVRCLGIDMVDYTEGTNRDKIDHINQWDIKEVLMTSLSTNLDSTSHMLLTWPLPSIRMMRCLGMGIVSVTNWLSLSQTPLCLASTVQILVGRPG